MKTSAFKFKIKNQDFFRKTVLGGASSTSCSTSMEHHKDRLRGLRLTFASVLWGVITAVHLAFKVRYVLPQALNLARYVHAF